ncbi:MAG: Sua5/YciO/YrdC/YwlC family protein [Chiayiivirga sp.]|uniref:Sua5/YciO/YrdC/YwlC family protein n=1 Tax=Chiayiivirga sp. TaxID=2041042 RepID=UPI0025C14E99|nr:Sua5/YciO/YrdC/YwlC family protein [Chiayiivirga sp.]MCI1711134.1 Sua5/YciO/YrdC/YwlC family protein [Chiayiivirga sp.]MCI1728070.1 Sua5/YciO/YrdC/YwlC family protein [Chiayiivirga sp.]
MTCPVTLEQAAAITHRGGVVAYPTEAVWGLGCNPFDPAAVKRLLALKQRPQAKGVILIAAGIEQLLPWIDLAVLADARRVEILASWPGPNTWALPCNLAVPEWLRGDHATLAARVTAHPVAAALCRAAGGPLVSTSANLAGKPPPRTLAELDPSILAGIDGWLAGETGGLERPTPIRDARTGDVLRS